MKLRNKKTGEIGALDVTNEINILTVSTQERTFKYSKLESLYQNWEDYEEPKEYYYIDWDGEVCYSIINVGIEEMKIIGNYFETREEAEEAVEKLKAWKRLKDRGFSFTEYNACSVDYNIDEQYRKYISQDLDLLFGGEE